jgi:hypothetical protein
MNDEANKDIIFEGSAGIYRRIDLSAYGDTSSLIPFDSDLTSLGFSLVGDLMCSALSGFLRYYVHPHERTRALLLTGIKDGKLSVFGLLFEAEFSGGASVTTTTSPAMKNMPERGIHRKVCDWSGVHDLYQKHRKHMGELKAQYGEAQPMGATLLALAESIDVATVRMNS